MKATILAPAKINVMLDILGTREDGYHDLFMVMQSIDIADTVSVIQTKGAKIELTCSHPALPVDQKNIAYRAAEAFFKAASLPNTGVKIHIEKKIPFAAGLAGGSADGAAVLLGLNELTGAGLSVEALCEIGLRIGADVPFCLKGGTMTAEGTGGVLTPLDALPECFIVLAKPPQDVSTAFAYGQYDAYPYECRHPDHTGMVAAIQAGDLNEVGRLVGNVFEQFIEVPDRVSIKSVMRRHGALGVCMSGSGPTIFGLFTSAEKAEACRDELLKIIPDTFLCHPLSHGCKIIKAE